MSLPLTWVEKIFTKLTLTYGRDFLGRYEGIPIADIKTDWSHELGGIEAHPEAIRHALQNPHPNKPPTVHDFKALCLSAPKMAVIALPAPKADPAIVKKVVDGLKASQISSPHGMKAWAYRLRAMESGGHKLSSYQAMCVNVAIGESA